MNTGVFMLSFRTVNKIFMKRVFYLATIAIVMVFAMGCNPNLEYEKYSEISEGTWHKDSLVVFDVPVTDTIQQYNLFFNVRNNIDYGYSNLWLFVEIEQPDGTSLTDKFELALAAPSGKWLGKGFGGLKTREAIYKRNVFFPVSGEYKIKVSQGMREDNLSGIRDVGLRIEKVD